MNSKIFTAEEISAQRELDKVRLEEEWKRLEEEAGGGDAGRAIRAAFEKLYTLYEPGLAEWFARLYDPEVGGYYATTSGHDTEGFGPDVEATVQSLRFIESSGMLRDVGKLNDALPEGMCQALLKFAKRLQNPNGYFYHPQWSFDDVHYNLSRRGRDLGWATGLISSMGGTPTYDTPNGIKGDGLDADGNPVEIPSAPVASPTEKKEDAPKATPYPEYLENDKTFLKYLETFDMENQSYSYGNQLNATYNQIRTRSNELIANGADYSLCDILINFLNERINPETGYWGDSLNFAGSNGFFKIITIYNAWGYPYPMPERVTDSVLSNIMGDEIPTTNCCSVYNLWCAIGSIRANVIKTQSEETRAKVIGNIDEILLNRGPEAILNTYRKMAPYRKGVAFSGSYDTCGGTQQSLYTGLNPTYGVLEGNVDAVCICSTGLTRCMFDVFGFSRPSLLTKADWMVYRNILLTNGAAKKTRVLDPNVTFEGDTVPKTVIPYGENELKVENGELIARIDGEDCGVSLIQTARICKGEYKLLEADLSFEDVSGEGKILLATNLKYLGLRPSGFIVISFEGDKVKIENTKWSEGFEYTFDCKSRSFKLKMEFYLDPAEMLAGTGKKCSAARVYIDGNYAGKYVNNDGTDPEYPSGIALNNENKISIIGIGDTKATMKMRHFRFAYCG